MTNKAMEMTENKIFSYALVLSLIIHAVLLSRFPFQHPRLLKETIRPIELIYQPVKAVIHKQETKVGARRAVPLLPSTDSRMSSSKIPLGAHVQNGPPLIKETGTLPSQWQLEKSQSVRIDTHSIGRKISVPELKSEKINNPIYLDYYQIVRNKIKERAYRNYSRLDAGEVYLTFVLASDGSLKQIKLVDEKTSAGAYLKDVGLKSIRDSSPFPSFPRDLAYPELSFNVVISFEVKN